MAAKSLPLPPDYVRPSLAEYRAAGLDPKHYEDFFSKHEAELRKHYVAPGEPAPAAEDSPPVEAAEDAPNTAEETEHHEDS